MRHMENLKEDTLLEEIVKRKKVKIDWCIRKHLNIPRVRLCWCSTCSGKSTTGLSL